ncbi:flagellar FliJ protein [Desulfobotulus alkaliphilus]|uniref:Flagellar FliJ protein n=1 Tax=Desulfobotulus alkaliphilus TaxID=622671 RepID=A0A562RVH3_9BACT|nr:hypothetical protein [Desulfobotulus alkaliphilus]TWI72420.1 flagellar FliJ protein [Desulfobotulus alkaliphilus]
MKRFVFRLESLLRYRSFQVKQALQALMAVQKLLEECEAEILKLGEDQQTALILLEKETQEGISGERFRLHTDYLADMEMRMLKMEERKKRILYQLREKQKLLDQARMAEKALENLKEGQRETYMKEMDLWQQKETDDMVSIRKVREGMS